MKIAFVSGNREKLPDAVIPLGLLYVMAATPACHRKELIDLCFEPKPFDALRARLAEMEPDLVAVGLRNIQANDYSGIHDSITYYTELIAAVRQVSDAPIVLGGGGLSVMPRQLAERLEPDFAISGEGERAFPQLVAALEAGGEGLDRIGNLHRRVDGQVVSTPAEPRFLDMDALAPPDRTLVDPRYLERYGIDSIQTKRGCPLRCEYCTYPLIEGRVGRVRDPAAVVDEMFHALESDPAPRHFFIVDSVFNLPKTHAKNVCRELIRRDWSVPWTCYANPPGLRPRAGRAGGRGGLRRHGGGFRLGLQRDPGSGSARASAWMTSGTSMRSAMRPVCRTATRSSWGLRGETLEHVDRTLDFVVDLDPFSAIIMIWIDDFEALDPVLRRERAALRSRIEERILEHKDAYPHWSIPPLGINFDKRLFRRLRRSGLHGPLWQHVRPASGHDPTLQAS